MDTFLKSMVALFKYLFDAAPDSKPNVLKIADVVRSVVLAFSTGGLTGAVATAAGIVGPQASVATTVIVPVVAFIIDLVRRYRHTDAAPV